MLLIRITAEQIHLMSFNCFQSSDFPLSVEMLLSVLEVIAPFKHFNKLRKFIQMKLPPGFPVKLGKLELAFNFTDFFFLWEVSLYYGRRIKAL